MESTQRNFFLNESCTSACIFPTKVVISSSLDNSLNISPSPVRSHSSFTLNLIHISLEKKEEVEAPSILPEKKAYVKVLFDGLAVRSKCSWEDNAVCGTVKKNEVFTVVGKQTPTNAKTSLYQLKSGLWITSSEKYVKYYEK